MSFFPPIKDFSLFVGFISQVCALYLTHTCQNELLFELRPCTHAFLCLDPSFLDTFMLNLFISFI